MRTGAFDIEARAGSIRFRLQPNKMRYPAEVWLSPDMARELERALTEARITAEHQEQARQDEIKERTWS